MLNGIRFEVQIIINRSCETFKIHVDYGTNQYLASLAPAHKCQWHPPIIVSTKIAPAHVQNALLPRGRQPLLRSTAIWYPRSQRESAMPQVNETLFSGNIPIAQNITMCIY